MYVCDDSVTPQNSTMPNPTTSSLRALRASGLLLSLFCFALLAACGAGEEESESPPPPVELVSVHAEDVEHYATYPGRLRGAREVEVRARVEGILQARTHTEGALVEQEEQLFRIDPRPFDIAVQRAEAEVANATASVDAAELEWRRISDLYEREAVSARDRDRAQSDLALARAQRGIARAGLEDARLQRAYTEVRAPITGITGLETVPEGSLVERGTLLTTMVQRDPVHLRFQLPEDEALSRRARAAAKGADASGNDVGQVELLLPDGTAYPRRGKLDFTDVRIDPTTGTVSARAVFPNPDGQLQPGQFLRVRLLLKRLDGVHMVPERAIAQGDDGPQVFVVEDGVAQAREIELGPVVDGRQAVRSGLRDGDRVVVSGLPALEDGDEVRVLDDGAADDAGGGSEARG